jgi:CheY-like chemotaxis protein
MGYEQPLLLIERRQHVRVSAGGDVILRVGEREIYGRSVVVSRTSLEVRCEPAFVLLSLAGASVEIDMRLDSAPSTGFGAQGRVARVRPVSHSLVINFGRLPKSLAKLLPDEARVAPTEVMVVDRDRARRTQVSDAFRAEGCHVVEASTSIEALDALTEASFVTDLIAVADTAPEKDGVELRDYLDTAYASALVVGIGDPEWIPTHAQLDPSDRDGELRARVRSLLLRGTFAAPRRKDHRRA